MIKLRAQQNSVTDRSTFRPLSATGCVKTYEPRDTLLCG